jgi:hypothetical protein
MTTTTQRPDAAAQAVRRAIARRSFCTLATSSPANEPRVVGVMYAAVDDVLYIATFNRTRKARNIRANPRVGVCIPVRRFPIGPPFCVQFGATAEVLPPDNPEVVSLVNGGRLKAITGHGVLDNPDTCFLRVVPDRKVSTYGIGVPLLSLLRDPLHADRTVVIG